MCAYIDTCTKIQIHIRRDTNIHIYIDMCISLYTYIYRDVYISIYIYRERDFKEMAYKFVEASAGSQSFTEGLQLIDCGTLMENNIFT